jgi:hypothetical protein
MEKKRKAESKEAKPNKNIKSFFQKVCLFSSSELILPQLSSTSSVFKAESHQLGTRIVHTDIML